MNQSHVNIIIPMAGHGSRFSNAGYKTPKPLIDIFGKTMIETVIENLRPKQDARFIFICQQEHYKDYGLEKIFNRCLGDSWQCVQINCVTEGAACTTLVAEALIDNNAEVIIANSDQIVDCDLSEFIDFARNSNVDGLVMTFISNDEKWSYIRVDSNGFGVEIAEKRVISPNATVGIYYFLSGGVYKKGARSMIKKNIRINNEFYVAPIYNELINNGGKVRIWEISPDAMHGIGTPRDLDKYFVLKGGYRSKSAPLLK